MGRNKVLETYLGKVYKLAHNPNKMSEGKYAKLMESLTREDDGGHGDIEFLSCKGFTIWLVPPKLPDDGGNPWPFAGQQNKLVLLGGNWRYQALEDLGYDKIPDRWVHVAKYEDGKWWSPEHAERFILLDNNPEGISGENDGDDLAKFFREESLRAAGIDYATLPMEYQEGTQEDMEEEVEEEEHGEMDQKLVDFIERRESSRGNVDGIFDVGFYTVTVFETYEQKMEWLKFLKEKYGVDANREVFVNGFEIAKALGKKIEYSGQKFPTQKPSKALQEMAYDGTEEGWEVNGETAPEGEEEPEEGEEAMDDKANVDGVI